MRRLPVLFLALASAALSGCEGSETDRLERIQSFPITAPVNLGGGGSSPYVGLRGTLDGAGHNVRFYRHDPLLPDALIQIGELNLAWSGSSDFSINGETAVLDGWQVVSLAGDRPSLVGELPWSSGGNKLAVAEGRWALVANWLDELRLVDLEAGGGPADVGSFTVGSSITGLLANGADFLAFTETGYVHVAPSTTPVFTERTDPVIRSFHRAFKASNDAIVAGPSIYAGKSRVARLDLSDPTSPALRTALDLDGEYGAFAWDGGFMSVLEVQGEPGAGLYQGYRVYEYADGFGSAMVSLPQWLGAEAHIAAHAGRLFALDVEGMGFYRIH